MRTYKEDKQKGLESEKNNIDYLSNHFNRTFNKLEEYNPFDFESEDIILEIKTRFCNYDRFPTTMLPYSKVLNAKKLKKTIYFIFIFDDGIYKIKFDSNFDNYSRGYYARKRADKVDKEELYTFIPIKNLTKI